jgi:hypothetical protein
VVNHARFIFLTVLEKGHYRLAVNAFQHDTGKLKSMCPGHTVMLGEFIGELKGKITGQRVLSVEGPKMETSISATGNLKGAQVTETLSYVASQTSKGVLHGVGNGVIMTAEGEW